MDKKYIAKATIEINAPISKVWDAFVNPAVIKQYMFGTDAVSDWKEGSRIIWKGEWKGNAYEDKGVILRMVPGKLMEYTHFSPMTGQPDVPENYHTVMVELTDRKSTVLVSLSQDNNATEEEKQHSEKNWETVLASVKRILEH